MSKSMGWMSTPSIWQKLGGILAVKFGGNLTVKFGGISTVKFGGILAVKFGGIWAVKSGPPKKTAPAEIRFCGNF